MTVRDALSLKGKEGDQPCYHLNHFGLWEDGRLSGHATSGFGDKASGVRIIVYLIRRYDPINVVKQLMYKLVSNVRTLRATHNYPSHNRPSCNRTMGI